MCSEVISKVVAIHRNKRLKKKKKSLRSKSGLFRAGTTQLVTLDISPK